MLVIKIEFWSHGSEEKAKEIARAYIVNDIKTSHTTKGKYGTYNTLFTKPHTVETWKKGKVEKVHRTKKNAWDILYLALKSIGMDKRNK